MQLQTPDQSTHQQPTNNSKMTAYHLHAMQAKKIISVKESSKENMTFGQITNDSKDVY